MCTSLRASSLLLVVGLLAVASGCAKLPRPFVPKAAVPPPVVYCNDYIGHVPGNKPFLLGGKCCCTPTDELMQKLHKDGICTNMSSAELRACYEQAGIAVRRSGHDRCNGLCAKGPHVALGGKCMCPPTPGTAQYEMIVSGKVPASQPAAAKKKA